VEVAQRRREQSAVPWLHYLAVDDGRTDRTAAWACPSELAGSVHTGDVVTLTARRWTRRVLTLRVDEAARTRALSSAGADEDTEQVILRAMNVGGARSAQALASAVHPPSVIPGQLLTTDEVGRVLGAPATLRDQGRGVAVGPMAQAVFQAADGSSLVTTVATGDAAELAIRVHRGGMPLPGLGDEAYAAGASAVARRGQVVVSLEQHSTTPVNQPYLAWLLGLAVTRLPPAR